MKGDDQLALLKGVSEFVIRGRTAHGDGRGRAVSRIAGRTSRFTSTRGFTLVELLVVLVIVGLAGTAVVLTAPGDGDTLARDADTLAARLLRAREEAVLAGRGMQVRVTASGYDYMRQDFDAWRPLHDGPFRPARFAEGTRAQVPASGPQAHVTFDFDPIGGNRPQAVVLEQQEQRVRIAIDATGEVSVDAVR